MIEMRAMRVWVVALALVAPVGVSHAQQAEPAPVTANGGADADALTRLAQRMAEGPAPSSASQQDIEKTPLGQAAPNAQPQRARSAAGTADDGWPLQTLGALGVVIGLILVAKWAWGRFGGGVVARSTPAVEVLSRTSVAPRNHVLLVRVGGRILVLGDSASGLRTLADVTEPDEVASLLEAVTAARTNSISESFSQLLNHNVADPPRHAARHEGGDDIEHRVDRARDSVSGLLATVRALSQKGER